MLNLDDNLELKGTDRNSQNFRRNADFLFYPRISNNVPLWPGIAPFNTSKLLSLSIFIIFKFLTDTLSYPILPGIFLPFITCWGNLCPTEPICLSSCLAPWVAFLP